MSLIIQHTIFNQVLIIFWLLPSHRITLNKAWLSLWFLLHRNFASWYRNISLFFLILIGFIFLDLYRHYYSIFSFIIFLQLIIFAFFWTHHPNMIDNMICHLLIKYSYHHRIIFSNLCIFSCTSPDIFSFIIPTVLHLFTL